MTNLLSAGELQMIREREADELATYNRNALHMAMPPLIEWLSPASNDRRRLLAHIEAMEALMHKAVETLNAIEGLKIVNKVDATGEEFPGSWQQYSTWKSELAREALREIGSLP
jgi:hypothetical protein